MTTIRVPKDVSVEKLGAAEEAKAPASSPNTLRTILRWLSPRNISAIYVGIIFFVIFAFKVPGTFLTGLTWSSILEEQAVGIILAIALLIPFAAGVFDVSVAFTLSLSTSVMAIMMVNHHQSFWIAAPTVIAMGALIGVFNAIAIAIFKVNSMIATLGSGTVLGSIELWVTNGGDGVFGFPSGFLKLGTAKVIGISWLFVLALAVAFGVWYVLTHTRQGRYVYAIGGNPVAAKLSGVPVVKYVFATLMLSGALAAVGGIALAAELGSSQPGIGEDYLLSSFAAVFLGSTQLNKGKGIENVWGTVIAILALSIATKGFSLLGALVWVNNFVYGLALIVSMAWANWSRRHTLTATGLP
jgi:ribose transport system permease protein